MKEKILAWWENNRCRFTGHRWVFHRHMDPGTSRMRETRWCRQCGRLIPGKLE